MDTCENSQAGRRYTQYVGEQQRVGEQRSGRAYEVVLGWVEQRVLSGEFGVGTVLPAERELAAQLGVSRAAVREAVRALSAMGIVDSRVGAGGTGGTVITAVPSGALNRFLRMHVALAQFNLADVVDVRVALECLSVELAARNASEQGLRALAVTLAQMEDDTLGIEEFNDLDTEFHVQIAWLAGNSLARDVTVAIRESMRAPIRDGISSVQDWPVTRAELRRGHADVMAALRDRDGERAAIVMRAHIRDAAQGLLGLE